MKKLLIIGLVSGYLNGTTVSELFRGIKNAPDIRIDKIMEESLKEKQKEVNYLLYPKISLVGSIEHFNNNNPLVSMTPTETQKGGSFPFGKNIERVGITLNLPLYVREIYKNKKRLNYLLKSTQQKTKINFLAKEALIVGLVSNYNYLIKLKKAILKQKKSITKTIESIKVGVKNGAIPEFNLVRLNDSIQQIEINILNIDKQITEIKSKIFKISKVVIDNSIKMVVTQYNRDEYIQIKPLKELINSDIETIEIEESNLYPKVYLKSKISKNWTKAYNTGDMINKTQSSIGIYFEWAIFDKQTKSKIRKAKLSLQKDRFELQKTINNIDGEVLKLGETLFYIKTQIKQEIVRIKLKQELLKSAKVAFIAGSMNVDTYLQYENNLALAKADLSKFIAQKYQTIANLSFIYGNNLEQIFKDKE